MNPELLDRSQADRALRDLMPVVEWLTNYDAAHHDGATTLALRHLAEAVKAFRAIRPNSPAIKAYIRWLEEDHSAEFGQ